MSTVVLGNKARENHGNRDKYSEDLDPIYKGYIDNLEKAMIICVYDRTNAADCLVVKTYNLNLSEEDIAHGIDGPIYERLETPIIIFCGRHKCRIDIQRIFQAITITVDLKLPFTVNYV